MIWNLPKIFLGTFTNVGQDHLPSRSWHDYWCIQNHKSCDQDSTIQNQDQTIYHQDQDIPPGIIKPQSSSTMKTSPFKTKSTCHHEKDMTFGVYKTTSSIIKTSLTTANQNYTTNKTKIRLLDTKPTCRTDRSNVSAGLHVTFQHTNLQLPRCLDRVHTEPVNWSFIDGTADSRIYCRHTHRHTKVKVQTRWLHH